MDFRCLGTFISLTKHPLESEASKYHLKYSPEQYRAPLIPRISRESLKAVPYHSDCLRS